MNSSVSCQPPVFYTNSYGKTYSVSTTVELFLYEGLVRLAYLFNQARNKNLEKVKKGELHDGNLYCMLRLQKMGVDAECVELESYFPERFCSFLRDRLLSIYTIHAPLLPKLLVYDLIFSPTAFGTQLLVSLLPLRKRRWVMYDFNILGFLENGRPIKKAIFKWLVGRSAGIVTIGEKERDSLQALFPELAHRIIYLPYGVDCDFFKPIEGVEQGGILGVGVDSGRDYRTLFEATQHFETPILIAGDPGRVKGVRYPIPASVQVRRFAPKDMIMEYAKASAVVIPLDISGRTNDAMGCSSLVEAMAMGKTVVVTRTPTTESYIEHGVNGFLVPPKDPDALREVIKTILSDSDLRQRVGQRAREWVIQNCDADRNANRLKDYFCDL